MKLSLLLLAALCVSVSGMTRVKKAKGAAVVEESLKILRRPCVFPDNYLFLRRLAYISTEDGHAINTFQAGYYGGIWKVADVAVLRLLCCVDVTVLCYCCIVLLLLCCVVVAVLLLLLCCCCCCVLLLLLCFVVVAVTVLCCCAVLLLRFCVVTVLSCCYVVLLLRCCVVVAVLCCC